MLILDDGWQSTALAPTGEQRLTSFSANEKFAAGLGATVRTAKDEFGVKTFLVWHAVSGYWGGVDGERLPGYGVVDQTRQFGEGILAHVPSFNQVWWGNVFGLVPMAHIGRFYDDYHRALVAEGVDGVKVDSQAVLQSVAQRQGGASPSRGHTARPSRRASQSTSVGASSTACRMRRRPSTPRARRPSSGPPSTFSRRCRRRTGCTFTRMLLSASGSASSCTPTGTCSRAAMNGAPFTRPGARFRAARCTCPTSRGTTTSRCSRSSCAPTGPFSAATGRVCPRSTRCARILRATARSSKSGTGTERAESSASSTLASPGRAARARRHAASWDRTTFQASARRSTRATPTAGGRSK